MKVINVGILGFGKGAQIYNAPIIQSVKGFNLKKGKTNNPTSVDYAKEHFPEMEVVSTDDDILDDADIQLVIIVTSNTSHFSLAKAALEKGKNVIVDKPFTITTAEADELIALANEKHLMLTVHQNRRFDGDFQTLHKLLESNKLGNIATFEIHFDRFRNEPKLNAWREEDIPGSGVLYDLGAHIFDQAVQLFGLPQSIMGDVFCQRKFSKAVDAFNVIWKYDSGLRIVLTASMLVAQDMPHYVLNGDNGSYVKYGMDPQEDALRTGEKPSENPNWGVENPANYGKLVYFDKNKKVEEVVPTEIGDYRLFYQNIYDHLTDGAQLKVQASESRNIIRLIELAMQSTAENKWINWF
ncbi:Gfo/Idh/MocA family oxidoreductase [Rhizosphaericola mali]|uniref:Oxidoreductase n=1 Tax=Rhizosphaericola mali TaxID=2545455 RepID=A0A5P2FV91_9BACT|nr:Gfo/Idh/MocA family oxidoreductase [Rhizosphaericola mali]QES87406.1 oxidoreductase [Rhizosphaericola mali]